MVVLSIITRRLFFILREFDDFCGKRGLPRLLGAGPFSEIQTFPIILTDNFLSGNDCYHIAIFSEIQRNDFAINRMKKLYDYVRGLWFFIKIRTWLCIFGDYLAIVKCIARIVFEELGADSLMVDEAHNFKNLMTVTKMHNIAGISTTESQKAIDLFMKCQYLDEITGARGVTFATGTPISNSMTELYTMQRYLQQYTLERNGLANFDSWAATFGETVTAIELAPEGTGYRTKTRFARFFNLPELMAMFKECADIQTADNLFP